MCFAAPASMRDAVLTSVRPTDPRTVRLALTSRCCRTQKKSCAASGDISLCNLDKDVHGREEFSAGHKHLVDLLILCIKMLFHKYHHYNDEPKS